MTNEQAIKQEIFGLVSPYCKLESADDISTDDTFEKLGMKSLDIVEAVLFIENKLGVEIHDDDAVKFNSVGCIVRYVDGITAAN